MTPKHQRLLAALRTIFTVEQLPAPVQEASDDTRPRPGLARALFGVEPLTDDPIAERPRRHLARMLFGIEPLPLDPPAAPRPRTRWLRWLFGPETLDS